jgi:hypothetical protein
MRCRILIGAAVVLLTASFCIAQTQAAVTATKADARLYSRVIRAEIKGGGLTQHDTVCLALPNYSEPNKSLLKALKSDGLTVKKPDKCLFRGYEIRVQESTPDSIRVQLVDVRYGDLAVILRDGVYVIEKDTTGNSNIHDYKAFQPSEKK